MLALPRALLSERRGCLDTLPKPVMPTVIPPRPRRTEAEKAIGESRQLPNRRSSSLTTYHPRGREGDELEDMSYNINNARRRSNSSTLTMKDFKTKFETVETEPVFEEELHGPMGEELEKHSTTSSEKSVDDEDTGKKL
jgi:hypothetical protein